MLEGTAVITSSILHLHINPSLSEGLSFKKLSMMGFISLGAPEGISAVGAWCLVFQSVLAAGQSQLGFVRLITRLMNLPLPNS